LHVDAFEAHDGITLHAHAKASAYDGKSLERLLLEFEMLLRNGCDSPATPVLALPLALTSQRTPGAQSRVGDLACPVPAPPLESEPLSEEPIVVSLKDGNPDKPPLVCILGIQLYVDLAMAITDDTQVTGFHCPMYYTPGRTPRPSLSQVATRYVDAIRKRHPKGPYHLAGLCFGGIVAFEVARLLQKQGEDVPLVVVLDSILPKGRHGNPTKRFTELARRFFHDPSAELRRAAELATLSAAEKLVESKRIREVLGKLRFTVPPPTPVDLPVMGDEAIADTAVFQAERGFIDSRLLLFRALQNEIPVWVEIDDDMGWTGKAKSLGTFSIPCEHLKIVRPPYSKNVATIIMGEIAGM
jgi:thioesterase domain-containing protein